MNKKSSSPGEVVGIPTSNLSKNSFFDTDTARQREKSPPPNSVLNCTTSSDKKTVLSGC